MATVFRDPLVTLQRPQKDPLQARQFVSAGLALLTAVALPPGQAVGRELPAQNVSSYVNRSWIEVNDLPRQLAVTLPVGKAAGLELAKPRIDPKISRDWQPVNTLARQLQVTLPFNQADWPLPDRIRLAAPENPIINIAATRTVVVAALPFNQFDWPLPDRRDSPLARDRQRVNDLGRQLQVTLPKQITDWPLPKRIPLRAPDTPPLNIAATNTIFRPFAQYDWRIPRSVDSASARDFLPGAGIKADRPFVQLGWSLPAKVDSSVARGDLTPSQPFALVRGPKPFAFYGWTLPFSVAAKMVPTTLEPVPPDIIPPEPSSGHERLRQSAIAKIDRALAEQIIAGVYENLALDWIAGQLREHLLPTERVILHEQLVQNPQIRGMLISGYDMTEIYAILDEIISQREDELIISLLMRPH